MERLASDLLTLSRMQNPDYQLEMEVLNVIAVAQDAMRGIRILMAEKQMQGSVDFEDACSLIQGDYDRIRQVFSILLQNVHCTAFCNACSNCGGYFHEAPVHFCFRQPGGVRRYSV